MKHGNTNETMLNCIKIVINANFIAHQEQECNNPYLTIFIKASNEIEIEVV
jgi:hypothetical protein